MTPVGGGRYLRMLVICEHIGVWSIRSLHRPRCEEISVSGRCINTKMTVYVTTPQTSWNLGVKKREALGRSPAGQRLNLVANSIR